MSLQQYFAPGKDQAHLIFFIILFLICWNLENLFGVSKNYKKWSHDKVNYLFIIPGALLQALLGYVFVKIILFENTTHYGISTLSIPVQLAIIFVGLDLTYYIYHLLMHKLKLVWKFHAVHHSDTVLNVSTSLREHPAETIIRLTQYMIFACLLGPAFWIISLHQLVQVASKIIIHANYRLPDKVDKYLSMIFITPNMHHVHHHYQRPYTDSNYGDLFSIWDRMFGTFTYLPKQEVKFGLDTVEPGTPLNFGALIGIKFNHDPNKYNENA